MHNKKLVSGIINASSSHHKHETSDSEEEEGGAHEDTKSQYRNSGMCNFHVWSYFDCGWSSQLRAGHVFRVGNELACGDPYLTETHQHIWQYNTMEPLRPEVRRIFLQHILDLLHVIIHAVCEVMSANTRNDPIPYHTSILSGQQWVLELLHGYPECIRCELGMHREVFIQLIAEL
jgi:hypothetical protein